MSAARDTVFIDGELRYWPMCAMAGCENRSCLRLGSKYCWPHTGSGKSPEAMLAELRRVPAQEPK